MASAHRDSSPASFLHVILQRIDAEERLGDEHLAWLRERRLHATIALYHEREFATTQNPWSLVKASGAWRGAGEPEKALALSTTILDRVAGGGGKLRSAVLTTRGGALRDCGRLEEAGRCARDAIAHDPRSFYPHNLLGAIFFQLGEPERGDISFEEAQRLGAQPRGQEAEMRGALERSGPEERRIVAEYLLRKDPLRYQWAAHYVRPGHVMPGQG